MSPSNSAKLIKSEQGFTLSGDIVFSSVSDLLKESDSYLKNGLSNNSNKSKDLTFVVDCKEMSRIDSAGIALLLEWQRQFTAVKKSCVFQGLSNQNNQIAQNCQNRNKILQTTPKARSTFKHRSPQEILH